MDVMGTRSLKRVEATKLHWKKLPEKGKPSLLIQLELKTKNGESFIYAPKYRDIFQLLSWFFKKEDLRYPRSKGYEGRDYLVTPIMRLAFSRSLEQVLRDAQLEDDPLEEEETVNF